MNQFKGTIFGLLFLILVSGLYFSQSSDADKPIPLGKQQLFQFEKHDVKRVEIKRPGEDPLILAEEGDKWVLKNIGEPANRTMVNRIKHQLHDLTSRAVVVDNPSDPDLYGLGQNAIKVTLSLANGESISFHAGDPNPTAVSHYIQPLPGDVVYTVKKSAMDYYALPFDAFREPRFLQFDSKDIVSLKAEFMNQSPRLPLELQKTDSGWWQMKSPQTMAADGDRIKRMLGRLTALKAKTYIDTSDDQPNLEQLKPQLSIELKTSDEKTFQLTVMQEAKASSDREPLAYYRRNGMDVIYVARSGMLTEFDVDIEELRNRQVLRINDNEIEEMAVTLNENDSVDFTGGASVKYVAEQWLWSDGIPVPGSTPKRLASAFSGLKAIAFYSATDPAIAGAFKQPVAEATLVVNSQSLHVMFGSLGEAKTDSEGNEYQRRYAKTENQYFLIDERPFRILQDMVREYNRKKMADDEKSRLQQRIKTTPDNVK